MKADDDCLDESMKAKDEDFLDESIPAAPSPVAPLLELSEPEDIVRNDFRLMDFLADATLSLTFSLHTLNKSEYIRTFSTPWRGAKKHNTTSFLKIQLAKIMGTYTAKNAPMYSMLLINTRFWCLPSAETAHLAARNSCVRTDQNTIPVQVMMMGRTNVTGAAANAIMCVTAAPPRIISVSSLSRQYCWPHGYSQISGLPRMKQNPAVDGLNPRSTRTQTEPTKGNSVLTAKHTFSATRNFFLLNWNLTCRRNETAMDPVNSALATIPKYKKRPCAVHVAVFPIA